MLFTSAAPLEFSWLAGWCLDACCLWRSKDTLLPLYDAHMSPKVGSYRVGFVIFVPRVASAGPCSNHNLRAGACAKVNTAFSQVNFLPLLTSLQLMHNVADRSPAHLGPGLIWWYCLTSVLYSLVWAICIVRPIIPFPDQHGACQN